MCGIAIIFDYRSTGSSVNRTELRTIRDHMVSRGPDASGEWFSGDRRIGLGHRRLSIIDLTDSAAQPMESGDGSVVLVLNGEIYNYQKIRADLKNKGYIFKSNSDTEVLLHLYEEKGEAMVHDLRGMFAFAIWNARTNTLLLARDPYGIKPLYYADDGKTIRIASQVKALLAGGHVSRNIDPAGTVGFFLTGSVPEPLTTYQEIRQVPAGSFIRVNQTGASEPQFYASVSKIFSEAATGDFNPKNSQDQVRSLLLDSIRHHLVSDVPVGVFLSAGIDSGALVGLMHDLEIGTFETVTAAFREFNGEANDEASGAAETSRFYGTQHFERTFTQEDFANNLDPFFEAMDQPTIDGLNTYFAAQAAREAGLKVVLSGLGGDELFGGYPSFRRIPASIRTFAIPSRIPFLGEFFRRGYSALDKMSSARSKLAGLMTYGGTWAGAYFLERGLFMPWELDAVMDRELAVEGFRQLNLFERFRQAMSPVSKNWFGRVATLEASLYMRNQLLRDTDWSAMAHSVEVRTPLVDIDLLKAIAPILLSPEISKNGVNRKYLLTQSLKTPLPEKSPNRAKCRFSVAVTQWLNSEKEIDSWRKVPALSEPNCSWAKRWAYVVMERQKSNLREGILT